MRKRRVDTIQLEILERLKSTMESTHDGDDGGYESAEEDELS
jgi:hypothetical protein